MPRFKIETSLFEPVMIEVEGGRTFESVPLSPFLIREISKLDEQRKAGTLDDMTAVTQQVALVFGLEPKEVETTDVRVLNRILEHVTAAMLGGKSGKVKPGTMTAVDMANKFDQAAEMVSQVLEVEAEKNAPEPVGGISQ